MPWGIREIYTVDFLDAIEWLKPIEGGYWPGGITDPNPTNLGITQKTLIRERTHLGISPTDVKNITQDDANKIYFYCYWSQAGCWKLSKPMDLIVFDTAVNCGVENADKMYLMSKGSALPYLDIRLNYYEDVSIKNPDLAPNLPGWKNRLMKLRLRCSL